MSAEVLVVCGSPVASSRSDQLTSAVVRNLATRGVGSWGVAVRDLPCRALTTGDHRHPAVRETAGRLAAADALVVVSPVYKSSVPGLLKCWFDLMPRLGLVGRSVLPVATARFADDVPRFAASLGLVLASMGAQTVLPAVGLAELDGPGAVRSPLLADALDTLCSTLTPGRTAGPVPDRLGAVGAGR